MNDTAILNLSSELPDRKTIAFDGVEYPIRHREELGIAALATLDGIVKEYGSVMSRASTGKEITDAEGDALEAPMRRLVDIFWDAPQDIREKLRPQQLITVMFAFTAALGSKPAGAPTQTTMNRAARRQSKSPATPASSSPPSSASTERPTH